MVWEGTIDCLTVYGIDSTIRAYFSFVITGVYGRTRTCGKI